MAVLEGGIGPQENVSNRTRYMQTAYAPPVAYLDYDAANKTFSDAQCADYASVTASTVAWSAAEAEKPVWYVVSGDVTIDDRITVTGDVRLILRDGAKLTASKGIAVNEGNSLTIYAQSAGDGAGQLIAGSSDTIAVGNAGIGGGSGESGGAITINGGTVEATGGANAAGIGGGNSGGGGTITINGGTVTANGGSGGAGIGGGNSGGGGTITINGGTVTATGGQGGAGIGGGNSGGGGAITISGGNVTATNEGDGDNRGSGIGPGKTGTNGTITLTWRDDSRDNISITSLSYVGDVTLGNQFKNKETGTEVVQSDFASLQNATVVALVHEHMWTYAGSVTELLKFKR